MNKRNFKPLAVPPAELEAEAAALPTQHIAIEETAKEEPSEPLVGLSLQLRKSLRDELHHAARDKDMTAQAMLLLGLQMQGLNVTEDDLKDRRRR